MARFYYVHDIFDTTSGGQIHQLNTTLGNSKTHNVPPTQTNDHSFHERYVILLFYPCTYLTAKVSTTYIPSPTSLTTATTTTSRYVRETSNFFFGYLGGVSLFYPCTYFITNLFSNICPYDHSFKTFLCYSISFFCFFCFLLCFSLVVSYELTILKYHNG